MILETSDICHFHGDLYFTVCAEWRKYIAKSNTLTQVPTVDRPAAVDVQLPGQAAPASRVWCTKSNQEPRAASKYCRSPLHYTLLTTMRLQQISCSSKQQRHLLSDSTRQTSARRSTNARALGDTQILDQFQLRIR